MGVYYLALPLGGALGYGIGGLGRPTTGAGRRRSGSSAFPGLLAAVAGLIIHDPGRGASEGEGTPARPTGPGSRDYLDLFRTPTFLFNTAGMAAVTFATGAYAAWGSTFYQTVRGHDDEGGRASGSAA